MLVCVCVFGEGGGSVLEYLEMRGEGGGLVFEMGNLNFSTNYGFKCYSMSYVNHDFISYVSLKDLKGYVDHKFKDFKN